MKKDDKKMLTLVAAVAAVGAFFYYRKRKKATAVAESSGQRLRYNATELEGLQIDINVGDVIDIASTGGPTQPDWALSSPPAYPSDAINLVGPQGDGSEGTWVWSVRGAIPAGGPGGGLPPMPPGGTVVVPLTLTNQGAVPGPALPAEINFSIKVHSVA